MCYQYTIIEFDDVTDTLLSRVPFQILVLEILKISYRYQQKRNKLEKNQTLIFLFNSMHKQGIIKYIRYI